jgi:ferritin-like metal-binding protein YciE
MAELQSLRSHLITELRDLLDAEQQLTKVLPDFAARASTPALRMAFEHHLRETEGQIKRLKQAFDVLGETAQPKRCEGMHGLIREGNTVVSTTPEGALRDAVMITSAQKVEHYEMAAYGTARTYATVLGEPRVASLLEDTLSEEKRADTKLTDIAEGKVNQRAAEEWHRVGAGLLEQTAVFAGRAVGIGARAVKRAADTVGLGRNQRTTRSISNIGEQVSSSVGGAIAAASHMAGDIASSARSQARRVTGTARSTSRRRTTLRNTSGTGSKRKTKKGTQKSKRR